MFILNNYKYNFIKQLFYRILCSIFYVRPIHEAIEKEDLEIIQLLLANQNLDINIKAILKDIL